MWWHGVITGFAGIIIALALAWAALVVLLLVSRPQGSLISEALRLLPDVLRLFRSLAADPKLPRGVRIRVALLLAYLALPIDLIPDFIPIIGHADDVVIAIAVLRSVIRRVGIQSVQHHWPGTDAGLNALLRLTGLLSHTWRHK